MPFILRDGSIWRETSSGELRIQASEVVDYLVDGTGAGLRADLVGLRLVRRPLPVRLVLRGAFPGVVRIGFEVRKGDDTVEVLPSADQAVVAGTWHPLDLSTLVSALALSERHGLDSPGAVSPGQYLRLLADPVAGPLIVDAVEGREGLAGAASSPIDGPPLGLSARLFPYQEAGSTRLRQLARDDLGALLADEMGLGKTLQVIVLMLELVARGPMLVVATASLLVNWERELGVFAPSLLAYRHSGRDRTGLAKGLREPNVTLVSYETLAQDLGLFQQVEWDLVVLDEAQNIRNPDARRSRAVKSLTARVPVAVTGTPMENRLQDVWSIGEFILPSLLGDRDAFLEDYPDSAGAGDAVGRLLSPVTIRRTVAEVADDLPALMSRVTYFELDSADRDFVEGLPAGIGSLTAERMVCAHAYSPPVDVTVLIQKPKVAHLVSMLREVFDRGQKALVFSSFTASLEGLHEVVRATFGRAAVGVLDGRVPADERQDAIDTFNTYPGPGVLLLNPKALGVGVNITGANHVVHFQPDWNPALQEQATKRAHRRGQIHPVSVHTFAYVSTVDMRALELQETKREIAVGVDRGLRSG